MKGQLQCLIDFLKEGKPNYQVDLRALSEMRTLILLKTLARISRKMSSIIHWDYS